MEAHNRHAYRVLFKKVRTSLILFFSFLFHSIRMLLTPIDQHVLLEVRVIALLLNENIQEKYRAGIFFRITSQKCRQQKIVIVK